MTSRIEIHVSYGDRDYDVDATIDRPVGIATMERNRAQLFEEIDRSVAKIKAAIEVNP